MTDHKIISIEHHQTLTSATDSPGWSERAEVSVRIFGDAVKSGWLAQFTGHHGNDLPVLLTLAMHGRPLKGDDLELLIRLGLATRQDEGRLYARITDEGLAAELRIKRDTADASTRRLAAKGLLTVLRLSEANAFRDSRGRYGGTKLYLISGDLSGQIVKEVIPLPAAHKNEPIHRARNLGTVQAPTVPKFRAPTAQVLGTNIKPVVDVVVDEVEAVRAYFLSHKGQGYAFTEKDERELAALFRDGFTPQQIQQGIEAAFELPSKPQRFVQCARVARQRFSPSGHPVPQSPVIRTTGIQTPEANQVTCPQAHASTQPPVTCATSPTPASAELQPAIATLTAILSTSPSDRDLVRLRHLATVCDEVAQKAGADGYQWLADALAYTLTAEGVKSPIRYAESILRWWMAHGKDADFRPKREGYKPLRKAPAKLGAPVRDEPVGEGDGSEVINGRRLSREEAAAFYTEVRQKREARRVESQK